MFTGIVQRLVPVQSFDHEGYLVRLGLQLDDLTDQLELGASVAVNGYACRAWVRLF